MDPVTAATTFASIVSLLSDFVAHRGSNEAKSFEMFMAWLTEQRHDEIRTLLESSTGTTIGIKALLGESQKEILDRLRSLDKSMAAFAAGIDTYRAIAEAVHPGAALSSQAISLLEQFHDSGSSKIIEFQMDSKTTLTVVDGPNNYSLAISDPRFIADDLSALVERGLLGLSHNGSGRRLYSYTRAAARLVESLRAV
jgi:hypothetical protein